MGSPTCRCIEQGAECGHLPECPYFRPTPPAPADDASGAEAVRDAARRAMGECGVDRQVFDVLWDAKVAPLLRALPLPAPRRDDAVVEARDRVFHAAGTAKVLRTVYEIGMEARLYRADADREAALRDVQDAEDAMDRAVIDYSNALAALRGTRPEWHGGGK